MHRRGAALAQTPKRKGRAMTTILTAGTDKLTGTAGSDVFTGKIGELQIGDAIAGGGGLDMLQLTAATPGTVIDALFGQTSGVEILQLLGKAATTVVLGGQSD